MIYKKEELPFVLNPQDIQKILAIGRRQTYELLKDPPFTVQRLGGRGVIKISRDDFFRWLDGEKGLES
ncbi:hypothetical protein J23TS9_06640 [Paenibacillus sp. J23TS9]|uniref:helix-turn-helix domain-containing protein n=1 Tax=Paenibacillus sp. J23TS9 TaxID=2807193 RepID=UPI001B107A57|nr:helix-turn-helix domain-containing protein [Paenibacillus sp. J23TS9]GIP25534.1 hypothetical protein J23TS9_06640 [Paenibacillus sp. J23TS9]